MGFYDDAYHAALGDDAEDCPLIVPGTLLTPNIPCILKRGAPHIPLPPRPPRLLPEGVPWWVWVAGLWWLSRRR
jgi:hypothetical protein